MRWLILYISLFATSLTTVGQGLVRSILVSADTSIVCTLSVRNFDQWEEPRTHFFRKSIATYLTPGDYVVRYSRDTMLLHSEWIHISTKWTTIYKYILLEHIPLNKIHFVRPKNRSEWDPDAIYLEF